MILQRAILLALLFVLPATFAPAQNAQGGGLFSAAIAKTNPRTVKIFGATIGNVDGYGTGLIVSDDGNIITGDGVFLTGSSIRVTLSDGSNYNAKYVRSDPNLKLALLDIGARTPDYFELTEQPIGQKGDWVLAISNAFKVAERVEPLSANLGVISLRTSITAKQGRREIIYDGPLILIDAITSNPGAGGGAVVTNEGQLVGMIGKVIESNETNTRLNYAVPQENLYNFLHGKTNPSIASTSENQQKSDLGLRLFRVDGNKSPAFVDRVIRSGPAAAAGIKPDDLIISIAGETIANINDYGEVVDTLVPNEEIVIVVKRRNDLLRLKIIPMAKQ